ncbi:MAG: hypothetical protein J6N45_09630 [Alphaproteobacteria bacterium]|nr:hypothetical protein [Alphaproteobacteria bacterium]
MQYSPELETDSQVMKISLSVGTLLFVPIENTNNFAFCSNNPKLQEWCENVEDVGPIKNKSIPKIHYQFAVSTLQDYLHNKPLGSHRRNTISIVAGLDKDEVIDVVSKKSIIVDICSLPVSLFAEISNTDEIYKKIIAKGFVDHHIVDKLPNMVGRMQKCSTRIAVDYADDISEYCARHNVKEIIIPRDSSLDAVCAAWLIREKMATGSLPLIAEEIAEEMDLVTYADFRLPPDKYIQSLPGCLSGLLSAVKSDKLEDLFNNPDNVDAEYPDYLNNVGLSKAKHLDSIANAEAFKILDILAKKKESNSDFELDAIDVKNFIRLSDKVSDYIKDMIDVGTERIFDSRTDFEHIVANAEVLPYEFMNPVTHTKESGKLVIVSGNNPSSIIEMGHSYYGLNTIMAVYGGLDRHNGDMYDIGIAPESAYKMTDVMKDICILINKTEAEKRQQIQDICNTLENKSDRTPQEDKRLEDIYNSLFELNNLEPQEAFPGASEQYGITDKDPSLLIDNSLIVAARHSLITEKCFIETFRQWAKNNYSSSPID